MNSLYPVQALLESDNCDYAFNNAEYYDEVDYDKFSKAYPEVIKDFLTLAQRNVQLLMLSESGVVNTFQQNHQYLHKQTNYRWVG